LRFGEHPEWPVSRNKKPDSLDYRAFEEIEIAALAVFIGSPRLVPQSRARKLIVKSAQ